MEAATGTKENQPPGLSAIPDNQGESESCTVAALAKAITEGTEVEN